MSGWARPPTSARPIRQLVDSLSAWQYLLRTPFRAASSASSRWRSRQGRDMYAREARVQGLKSRAAFKLLEMDAKYKLFKPGQTVVDLGFAPGSWSQVAIERTKPFGKIVGIDLLPAQPPRGMSTIQGNFLSPDVQAMTRRVLSRMHEQQHQKQQQQQARSRAVTESGDGSTGSDVADETVVVERPSYIDMERAAAAEDLSHNPPSGVVRDLRTADKLVDIIISDMSEPWEQTSGFGSKTLSSTYHRLMNTSGNAFRDHAGSMDLCTAALQFASDTLKNGGHFICKFYQGGEDKALEQKLKRLFAKVHREKPDSSRSESKEAYFVALRKRPNVTLDEPIVP